MITLDTLKELYTLRTLSDEQLEKINRILEVKNYSNDAYVQRENEICYALYVVMKGRISIEITLPRHRKIGIYFVQRGDLFGWSALVPPHIITADSFCMEDCELLEIPREPLLKLFETDLSLKAAMFETVSHVIATRLKDTRLQLSHLLGWD